MGSENSITKNREIKKPMKKELFSSSSAPWQQDIINDVLSELDLDYNSICLDAACGIGNNIETLLDYFNTIFAFDKKKKAVKFSKKRYSNISSDKLTFYIDNLENIDFRDNFFDCVVCTEALEHVKDKRKVIKEIFRIVKYDGYVILSFQNYLNFSLVLKLFFEFLGENNWDAWGTHDYEGAYESYINCIQIKSIINKLDFHVIDEFGADYINAWLSWVPYFYRNYEILDNYPIRFLGKLPVLKYLGMDYFIVLKKYKK